MFANISREEAQAIADSRAMLDSDDLDTLEFVAENTDSYEDFNAELELLEEAEVFANPSHFRFLNPEREGPKASGLLRERLQQRAREALGLNA